MDYAMKRKSCIDKKQSRLLPTEAGIAFSFPQILKGKKRNNNALYGKVLFDFFNLYRK